MTRTTDPLIEIRTRHAYYVRRIEDLPNHERVLIDDITALLAEVTRLQAERDQLRDQFRQVQTDSAHQSIRMEQQRTEMARVRALLTEAAAWHEHWPDPVHCERCPRLRTGLDTARGWPR